MTQPVTAADVLAMSEVCERTWSALASEDWTRPARDLEWSCHETLTHLASAIAYYAVNLATRSTEPRPGGRTEFGLPLDELIVATTGRATVLASLIEDAPPDARGGHTFGRADPGGFAAMGCDELLIHTYDITSGFGATFGPPRDVCARVLARLFPWVRLDVDPWDALRWANGRVELGGRPRLPADWVWHSRPLEEWDGSDPTSSHS